MSEKLTKESSSDGLPGRRQESVSSDVSMPNFRQLNLGSPVSPLRKHPTGLATAATPTSRGISSSSGHVLSRFGPTSTTKRPESTPSTHSGNISGSSGSSPKAVTQSTPSGHQSGSCPKATARRDRLADQSGSSGISLKPAIRKTRPGDQSGSSAKATGRRVRFADQSGSSESSPKAGDQPGSSESSPKAKPGRAHSGDKSGSGPKPTTRNTRPDQSGSGRRPKSTTPNPRASQTRPHAGTTKPRGRSGQSTPASPPILLRAGNLMRGGRWTLGIATFQDPRPRNTVLGFGTVDHGYGNIVPGLGIILGSGNRGRGSLRHISGSPSNVGGSSGGGPAQDTWVKTAISGSNPEEVNRQANEMYKKHKFAEALGLYDRAILLSPKNADYRNNRAAALFDLNRFGDAIKEYEEALKLEPDNVRANQNLASLFRRMGQAENALKHLKLLGDQKDAAEEKKLKKLNARINRCGAARLRGDWKTALKEADVIIASGVDLSAQIAMCRSEALWKVNQLEDAKAMLSKVPRIEPFPACCSINRFGGILCEAYVPFVEAQIEMALGKFESAVAAADKAADMDRQNQEVVTLAQNVTEVARARVRGNNLYTSERYTEATTAYTQGLSRDPCNAVLYCNRSACWFKLKMWERTIEDCNQALYLRPMYTKPLLRRAISHSKLERWAEAVKDYELLKREVPDDEEIAESLFKAQVALRKSRSEEVSPMKYGSKVEEISTLERLKAATSLPGSSVVVQFVKLSDSKCSDMPLFVDALSTRYPSLNFLRVDMDKYPEIGEEEKVKIDSTFKIYKKGKLVKEIVSPSLQVLDYSLRHYSR